MRKEPYGHTIFCDDIRQEVGNKASYMGIYRNNIRISDNLPILLPKFCMAIHFCYPGGIPPAPIEIRVFVPGDADDKPTFSGFVPDDEFHKAQFADDVPAEDQHFLSVNFLVLSPFMLKDTGRIKVRAYVDGEETRLGTLAVEQVKKPESD